MDSMFVIHPGWTDAPDQEKPPLPVCVWTLGVSKSDGGRIHMWKCHNGANQDWTYMPDTQQIKDKNEWEVSGSTWRTPDSREPAPNLELRYTKQQSEWEIVGIPFFKPGTNKCVNISNNSTKGTMYSCGRIATAAMHKVVSTTGCRTYHLFLPSVLIG
jgi:hypothetical protein